jgi:hypothetical protein
MDAIDNNTEEVSLDEMKKKFKSTLNYLFSQWWKILIIAIIGAASGYFYAKSKPISYSANLSFVVEEGKSSSGGLSSLAGQFGIDIGSTNTGSGLLFGENLLLFLKSTSLVREVLLSPYDSSKNYSLADEYANKYKLRKRWLESEKIGKEVFFPVFVNQPFSRLQDSLLQIIGLSIIKKELVVQRPEKKATFILVQANIRDELLSKYFCERLVQKATERYVQSKIKRQKANVDRLQKRADSIGAVLNNKTFNNASDLEKVLDVNPAARTATVGAEVSSRDKMMLTTIYGEVVKNLELAKVQLIQETPTIQIVDGVELPLTIVKKSGMVYFIIGGCIGGGLIIAALLFFRKIPANN